MSAFVSLTPYLQIVMENPLGRKTYPDEGTVTSLMDTGYEGFASVPGSVFQDLGLNELRLENRRVVLADRTIVNSKGCYATIQIPHLSIRIDGFIETFPGLEEIVVGTEALSTTRVLLDYCARRVKIEPCSPRTRP